MTATLNIIDALPAISGEIVTIISEDEARQLTSRLHKNLEDTQALVLEAFEKKIWLALGYTSWNEYITGEFSGLELTPPKEDRLETIATYTQAGMSTRAISAVTGLSPATVARTQKKAHEHGMLPDEKITKTLDGREIRYSHKKSEPTPKSADFEIDESILDAPASALGIAPLTSSKSKSPEPKTKKPVVANTNTVSNETADTPADDLMATGFENTGYLLNQLSDQIKTLVLGNGDKNFSAEDYPFELVQSLLRSMASSAHLLKRLNLTADLIDSHEDVATQLETIVANLDAELSALRS